MAQDVIFVETPALVDMGGTSPAITAPPFSSGTAMGVVDLNGDRRDDIVRIHDVQQLVFEFQGAPDQAFQSHLEGTISFGWGWSVCAGDVDGNGINDVIVGGNYSGGQDLYLANGDGSVHTRSPIVGDTILVQGTILTDLDNDGDLDVFACDDVEDLEKFLNNGSGVFTSDINAVPTAIPHSPPGSSSDPNKGNYAVMATDYDNDGDIDYYVSKCWAPQGSASSPQRINRLFERTGAAQYSELVGAAGLADGAQSWCADFGDIDNDGDLDAFLLNHDTPFSEESGLYLNDGSGSFSNITSAAGLVGKVNTRGGQALFRDFDNDGDVDLLCSAQNADEYDFFRNNGNGTFTELTDVMKHAGSPATSVAKLHSIAIGDLNHDGFLDVYAGRGNGYANSSSLSDLVLINQGNSNGFTAITLIGETSNRNGVGARVEAHGPWGIQIREVRGGEGYGIMNSLNTHFGLGAETEITKLVVKWPSGTVDEILNVKGNRFVSVHEGTAHVAQSFGDWIGDYRAEGDEDGTEDNPDGDPVPNLFEQLMGTHPNEGNGWKNMSVSVEEDGGEWMLVELDRVPAQDISIVMEVSSTGGGWSTSGDVEVVEDSPTRYAARVPITPGNPTMLARLRATDVSPF